MAGVLAGATFELGQAHGMEPRKANARGTAEPKKADTREEAPFDGPCASFRVTAYWPGVGPRTADGTRTNGGEWTLVAVDPSVIRLGSVVWIDGLAGRSRRADSGFRAADTGGGVIGRHIDVLMYSYEEAIEWGSQTRVACWQQQG